MTELCDWSNLLTCKSIAWPYYRYTQTLPDIIVAISGSDTYTNDEEDSVHAIHYSRQVEVD